MSRQAILHLEAAVRADPRWALPYADLGHARLAFEEFGQAREAFRMALFLDPERADLWHPLAYCDLRLELWQEAAGALEKLVSLRPEDAIAWARLGAAYRYLGRVDAGARALAKGLELGCDEPWVWFEAGLAAVALGDRPAVEKAQHVLEERDADLARRFEARVVELGRSVGPTDACPAPASTEPARKEEAPSC